MKHPDDLIEPAINKLILQDDKIVQLKPKLMSALADYDVMIVGPRWLETVSYTHLSADFGMG